MCAPIVQLDQRSAAGCSTGGWQPSVRPVLPRNGPSLAERNVMNALSYVSRTSYAPRFVTFSTVMSTEKLLWLVETFCVGGATRSIA